MKNMVGERVEHLNKALSERKTICNSRGALKDFPSLFYKPFRTFGIGLIVCLRGDFDISVGTDRFCVHADETVILSEDAIFCVLRKSEDLSVHILFYSVELIRDLLSNQVQQMQLYVKMSPTAHYVWSTHQEEDLVRYMVLLEKTTDTSKSKFMLYEQRLLLLSLTYRLCSIFQHKFLSPNSVSQRRTEVFLRLIELIDRYYIEERGVGFYANELCLSRRYLSELSKSVCGYSVQELIFKTITRRCMTVLSNSTKPIRQISQDFKFVNPSSFGTFFKKQTGMSPRRFREMNKEG